MSSEPPHTIGTAFDCADHVVWRFGQAQPVTSYAVIAAHDVGPLVGSVAKVVGHSARNYMSISPALGSNLKVQQQRRRFGRRQRGYRYQRLVKRLRGARNNGAAQQPARQMRDENRIVPERSECLARNHGGGIDIRAGALAVGFSGRSLRVGR